MRKLRLFGALFLLSLVSLFAYGGNASHTAAAPADQAGAKTFTVTIGHETFTEPGEKSSWQANRFYPETITINEGDAIMFKHDSGINPHTASLLGPDNKMPDFLLPPPSAPPSGPPRLEVNPLALFEQGARSYNGSALVSTGAMAADIPGPKEYNIAFPKAGVYTAICFIHSVPLPDGTLVGMQVKITVQAAGSAYPMTPAQVDAAAKSEMAADDEDAKATEPEAKKQAVAARPGPNGSTVYHVNSGYQKDVGQHGALEYVRFAANDLTINVGDTVEWSSPTPHSFHNVTFGVEPEIFEFEPQASGPPKAYVNPIVFLPMGEKVYRGSGTYSSGILEGPDDPPFGPSVTNYALTFSAVGRFEYVCGLHYHNGMDGHVTVRSALTTTPGMPRTGSANEWTLLVLALFTGLALTYTGFALRKHALR